MWISREHFYERGHSFEGCGRSCGAQYANSLRGARRARPGRAGRDDYHGHPIETSDDNSCRNYTLCSPHLTSSPPPRTQLPSGVYPLGGLKAVHRRPKGQGTTKIAQFCRSGSCVCVCVSCLYTALKRRHAFKSPRRVYIGRACTLGRCHGNRIDEQPRQWCWLMFSQTNTDGF